MPIREQILVDLLYEGELEDLPTTSGEHKPSSTCSECMDEDGKHHPLCTFNHDLWNETNEILITGIRKKSRDYFDFRSHTNPRDAV